MRSQHAGSAGVIATPEPATRPGPASRGEAAPAVVHAREGQPFYVAPGQSAHQRRLLLVSYCFPPDPAVGGLRWQKLARFAHDRGLGLDVITLDPADLTARDDARLEDLPAGTRLFGVHEPPHWIKRIEQGLLHWRARRRQAAATPATAAPVPASPAAHAHGEGRADSLAHGEIRWSLNRRLLARSYFTWVEHAWELRRAKRVARIAKRIVGDAHEAIVVSSPPHMAIEGARRASAATGLPLVLDFRDPWSLVERLPEVIACPLWFHYARRYETRAMRHASLVVTNTGRARTALAEVHPASASRIVTVMNGYDDDPLPAPVNDGRFVIAYAGSIYLDRDPRLLFRAARQVATELGLTPAELSLEFIGNVGSFGGITVPELAREEGVHEFVRTGPSRPRRQAMEFLAAAAMLVILPQDSEMAIPAKAFEYMRFSAWILALANPASATAELLESAGADVVSPSDTAAIADVIRARYGAWRAAGRPAPIADSAPMSRAQQAALLFDALETRLPGRRASAGSDGRR